MGVVLFTVNCHIRSEIVRGRQGEGMLGAVQLLREGFDETARSLVEAAASGGGNRSGVAGAVGGVLRAVPSTMVRPVILGAAATSNLLDGVKNQISPDQRVDSSNTKEELSAIKRVGMLCESS